MILASIESVLSLLILIYVGFHITGNPWFGTTGSNVFSKYTLTVGIPAYMTYNVITSIKSQEELLQLFANLPIPIFTILVAVCLGGVLAKVLHIDKKRQGVFINLIGFSNTVIIGFPVIISLFGEASTPTGMIYYMANTILFWTIGAYLLRRDGGENPKFISLQNIKKIFSPPIIGFLIGMVIVLCNITLPNFIFSPLSKIAGTTTPIALMFIGSIIRKTDFSKIQFSKDVLVLLGVRFVFLPIFMVIVCALLPVDLMIKQVFFILSTMPAMTQLGIMSKESNSDYEFASVMVALTTTVSMVTLPIYMILLTTFTPFG